jgi:hypothetical protein
MRMIASGYDQLRIRYLFGNEIEGVDHQLQPFVSAPLAEGENSMFGISAPRKVRWLRPSRQDAMGSDVHIVAAILFCEDLAIARHKHRHGIRQEENSCSHCARPTISSRKANAGILQIYSIHQVMQRDMGVTAVQAREKRRHQPGESNQRIAPERAKQQIKPDDIGLQFADRLDDAAHAPRIIKRPTALHREFRQFGLAAVNLVGKNRKTQERIALQLLGNM